VINGLGGIKNSALVL